MLPPPPAFRRGHPWHVWWWFSAPTFLPDSRGGEVDGTYIPAGDDYKVDSRILRGLETTTELDFQLQ